MRKFNCLLPTQKVRSPHFLKASAGTGKTFAIEHIVARLIIEEDIDLRQILVVTFTKAATRELKQRLRKRLELSSKILQEKIHDTSVLYLQDLSKEERYICLERVTKALCFFDEAEVFTIHGFCYRALSEYSFEAKSSIAPLSEEMQHIKILKEEIFHTLKSEVSKDLFLPLQLDQYFKSHLRDLSKITKRLLSLLLKDATFPKLLYFSDFSKLFQEQLHHFKKELSQEFLEDDLEKLGKVFKGLCRKDGKLHLSFLDQVKLLRALSSSFSEGDLEDLLKTGPLFLSKLSEEFMKKRRTLDPETVPSYPFLLRLKDRILEIYSEAISPVFTELKLAKLCFDRSRKVIEALDLFSPDDILKRMRMCLKQEKFKNLVQNRYKAALIDEFQDTDPVQWEIFHELFKPESGFPLYLIGDPKQSIYGFRNADLNTYLMAEKTFEASCRYSLDTNFRSDLTIIETLNVLFSKKHAKGWLSQDGSLVHDDVNAGINEPQKKFSDDKCSVHFSLFEGKKSLGAFPTPELEKSHIFPWIAKEIKSLSKGGLQLQEIAILIKDRYQAGRLERYLESSRIPSYCKNTSHIALSKAYGFMKALLYSLENPFDKSLIKTLLAHPFMGFSHLELKEESKVFTQSISQIRRLSNVLEDHGFAQFWIDFLNTSFRETDFTSSLLSSFEEEHYHDLFRLSEIVLEECSLAEDIMQNYIKALQQLEELEEGEDDKVKKPQVSSANSVQIMTTHMSKGLEFDVVFALGTSSRAKLSPKIITLKSKKQSELQAFEKNSETHQNQLRANNWEKSRLLYVSLTRAKSRIYIPVFFEERSSVSEFDRSPIEIFVSQLSGEFSKKRFLEKLKELQTLASLSFECIDTPVEKTFFELQRGMNLETKPELFVAEIQSEYINSFSSMTSNLKFDTELLYPEDPENSVFYMPPSKETGVLIHDLLDKIFERGLHTKENSSKLKQLVNAQVKLTHLDGYEEVISEVLLKLMGISLIEEKPGLALKEIKTENIITETEFFFTDPEIGATKGFTDLILIYENTFYMIDWKTNYLGDTPSAYSSLNMEKVMKEKRYDFQAALYSKALTLHLKNFDNISFGGAFYIFLRALDTEYSSVVFLSPGQLETRIIHA